MTEARRLPPWIHGITSFCILFYKQKSRRKHSSGGANLCYTWESASVLPSDLTPLGQLNLLIHPVAPLLSCSPLRGFFPCQGMGLQVPHSLRQRDRTCLRALWLPSKPWVCPKSAAVVAFWSRMCDRNKLMGSADPWCSASRLYWGFPLLLLSGIWQKFPYSSISFWQPKQLPPWGVLARCTLLLLL